MMSNFNQQIFNLIHSLSNKNLFLDSFGVFLAQYFPYFLVLGILMFIFKEPWDRRLRLFFLCEVALALILSRGLLTEIIRFFYHSPQPSEFLNFTPLIPESGGSFPSGHAAFLFALSTIIFYWNRNWGSWYSGFSLLNGLARIFVGVHWPIDILGGAVIGIAAGFLVHQLFLPHLEKLRVNERVFHN